MKEPTEVVLRLIEQNYLHLRQHQDQRATITGLIVLIASAIQGGLTQIGLNTNSLILTTTLIVIGLFGILSSIKLEQRCEQHSIRIRLLFHQLDTLVPEANLKEVRDVSDKEIKIKYKLVAERVRSKYLWIGLHLIITLSGVIYSFIIILK